MVSRAKVILISAIASGQGKTTATAALARKLIQLGKRVRLFKCGPDFIDPQILEVASRAPVFNLDGWMVGWEESHAMISAAARECDYILIEGVMGLYDGTPSAADLAKRFSIPVLPIVDASAMAQTLAAVVHGLRDYGPVQLAGVLANRIASEGHAAMVRAALNTTPLLGVLARNPTSLPERHLGLVLPNEINNINELLDQLAANLTLDMDALDALPYWVDGMEPALPLVTALPTPLRNTSIAVARDAAFCFMYPANLQLLERLGAHLLFFSPLANEPIPAQADAVYLPGGYPELYGAQLQAAINWQESVRHAHQDQIPIWAECGGMMSLVENMVDKQGKTWRMAGILAGQISMQSRLTGLGPQQWETTAGVVRGHTFHYSNYETSLPPLTHTIKHKASAFSQDLKGEAVYQVGSCRASYFHAYFPSSIEATTQLFLSDAK